MKNFNEVEKKIGYGLGTTIGFTLEGTVFYVSDTKGPEGEPMQIFAEVSPARAEEIATALADAAVSARKSSAEKVH